MLILLGHCEHCECSDCEHARAMKRAYVEQRGSRAKWVPHITLDGARFHVLSWDSFGARCSEPRCEINRKHAEENRRAEKQPWRRRWLG
jgi:hypothetical protein